MRGVFSPSFKPCWSRLVFEGKHWIFPIFSRITLVGLHPSLGLFRPKDEENFKICRKVVAAWHKVP